MSLFPLAKAAVFDANDIEKEQRFPTVILHGFTSGEVTELVEDGRAHNLLSVSARVNHVLFQKSEMDTIQSGPYKQLKVTERSECGVSWLTVICYKMFSSNHMSLTPSRMWIQQLVESCSSDFLWPSIGILIAVLHFARHWKVKKSTRRGSKSGKSNQTYMTNFDTPVAQCHNYLILDHDHRFVDLERVVDSCVSTIYELLPCVAVSPKCKKPPLALVRFSRGGKTITLAGIFDKLKKEGRVNPVLITFNGCGVGRFMHRDDESDSEAILRLIASQMVSKLPENARIDRASLDAHLGNNVVLLIDELNILGGEPLDRDAAQLLREMFLDRAGRFLVFTSHFPLSIEPENVLGAGASGRGIRMVSMSLGFSLAELRTMSDDCAGLTEEYAAWHGHVPSLIYSTRIYSRIHGSMTTCTRFRQAGVSINPLLKSALLAAVARELLSGMCEPDVAKYYRAFASVDANLNVFYPLCYVKEMLTQFVLYDPAAVELVQILTTLEDHLLSTRRGLTWECIVTTAIILRMFLSSREGGTTGPIPLAPSGVKPELTFHVLPAKCKSLLGAKTHIDAMAAQCTSPSLIHVTCTAATSTALGVRGFVVYTPGIHGGEVRITGYQTRSAEVKATQGMDFSILSGGVVLIPSKGAGPPTRASARHGESRSPSRTASVDMHCRRLTTKEVRELLGHSLLYAAPRDSL